MCSSCFVVSWPQSEIITVDVEILLNRIIP